MTPFLVLGGLGVAFLVVGLVVGEVDVDVDLGPDWVSLPVLAALVGAFGFVGAAVVALGAPTSAGIAAGVVGGLVLAAATARLMSGLLHMPTDATPRAGDVVGRPGRIVTALTADRTGEVLVRHAGQQLKFSALGDETLAVGAEVVVVEVVSPTLVRVEAHDRFWNTDNPPN